VRGRSLFSLVRDLSPVNQENVGFQVQGKQSLPVMRVAPTRGGIELMQPHYTMLLVRFRLPEVLLCLAWLKTGFLAHQAEM
jgi:hypothetical protein